MKKTTCSLFSFFTAFCVSQGFAETTLNFPKDIEILALNGKEVSGKRSSMQLPDGENQLLVRLVAKMGRNFDADMEYSDAIILKFSTEKAQIDLVAPKIKSALDMKTFNRETNLQLFSANNTPVAVKKGRLLKSGFQLARDYEQELREYNKTDAPAALAVFAESSSQQPVQAAAPPVQPTSVTPASTAVQQNAKKQDNTQNIEKRLSASAAITAPPQKADDKMAEEMLRYWYEKADEKTKQKFLQQIKKN